MASEALLRSGGSVGEAQDYYARVVKRAMGDDYKVPTVSLDNIYKERRYEFAMKLSGSPKMNKCKYSSILRNEDSVPNGHPTYQSPTEESAL